MAEIYTVSDFNKIFAADIDQIATWINGAGLLNAKGPAWNAAGNGSTDDTTPLNNALAVGNSVVLLGPGTYKITNTLNVSADNVQLIGCGRSTIIDAAAAFPASPMIHVNAPVSGFRYGFKMSNLIIRNINGATGVTGAQLDSTYWAKIDHVDFEDVFATNIYLNGSGSFFGAYTKIDHCHIGTKPGGAVSGGIGLLTNNHEFNTIRDCTFNWFKNTGGYAIKLQNGSNVIDGCTFDENDTSIWSWFQNHNSITNNKFDRGYTQFIYLNGCKDTVVGGNSFQGFAGTGSKTQINIDGGSSNASNLIENNTCKSGTGWTNFVTEAAGTYTAPNTFIGNDTAGLAITRNSGIFARNRGYNPIGAQTAPGIPATTVALTNPFGVDCMVSVSGGTVTNVGIGGTNTGLTSGWFRIPANSSITLTYTVAPTWAWYGE